MRIGQLVQVILLGVIALILWHVAARRRRGEISLGAAGAWVAFWGGAALLVVFQELATALAHSVGVGRGVDLVIYFSLVLIFYILFRLLAKVEQMSRDLTEVVRQLAIEVRRREDLERSSGAPRRD